ncbi:hypothetical protein K435DRAFT_804892 [Dendrothele bispora CBS 962.96]|uniref:Uncharacterized protein n=1 Tax=Dendrothele bispora (strain CBS 962.96) TaxID=1314807 RepID=A0A4S8LCR8_DENBC|nr:hypothetical protein K435DRAFT_804892 [Dendrothele bispora CBS 962.96]
MNIVFPQLSLILGDIELSEPEGSMTNPCCKFDILSDQLTTNYQTRDAEQTLEDVVREIVAAGFKTATAHNKTRERRLDICNGEAEADGRSGGSSHEDEVEDGASFSDEADCRLNKAQLGEDNVHVVRLDHGEIGDTGYKEEDDGFFMGHAAEVFKDEVDTDGLVDTDTVFRFREDGRDVFHDFWVLISSSLAATMLLTYQQLHESGSTLLLHLLRQTGQLSPPLLHGSNVSEQSLHDRTLAAPSGLMGTVQILLRGS